MDFNRTVLWFYLLLLCVSNSCGKFKLVLETITNEFNPVYMSNVYANITPDKYGVNAEFKFLHDPCNDVAAIAVQIQQSEKQNLMSLLNFKIKVGDLIKGMGNNLLKLIHEALQTYSNVPKKCPLAPNFVWRFHNFSVNLEKVPLILSNFNFVASWMVKHPNSHHVLNGDLKGRLACKERKGLGCGFKRG